LTDRTHDSRNFRILLWLSLAVLVFSFFHGLNSPPRTYFDEVHHVKGIRELVYKDVYFSLHEPLGILIPAIFVRVLGDEPWVWRFVPATCGIGCVILLYILTQMLTQKKEVSYLAAFFFFASGFPLVQSRQLLLNSQMFFFMLAGLCLLIKATGPKRTRLDLLWLSAALTGAGFATRWAAFYIVPLLWWVVYCRVPGWKNRIKIAALYTVAVPMFFYVIFHLPILFFKDSHNHPLTLKSIWSFQVYNAKHHLFLKAGHPYGSSWWSWPLMLRPICFYYTRAGDVVEAIFQIANPPILWAILPAMVYMALPAGRWYREGKFVLVGYLSQWLIWAPVKRVCFFHYYYCAAAFGCIALALLISEMVSKPKWRPWAIVFIAIVVISYVYWLPIWTSVPIKESVLTNHFWFKRWI